MKLSKNFTLKEFECSCGCEMPKDVLNNVQKLAYHLQRLRDKFNKPIKINSAYRCESHNKAIGGSKKSQHKLGFAADIVVKDKTPDEVYDFINKLQSLNMIAKGGLGRYNTFTHFDIRGYTARWDFRK
ncbi:endolysin [Nonlabens phage P12024S]|uniref:Peptidase M15 n=1 Tax=Nonlabens phage P12024S TaxID=1168478 RepID=I6R9L6_9CAUD|nr:endolysin [Nonlabens phage P12024S]AFM54674.1 peptidase M15 [Nonlabens phage P12024S]